MTIRLPQGASRAWLALALIAVIVLIDWKVEVPISFGFLYLLPLLLLGTVWKRSGIVGTALGCTLLSILFDPATFTLRVGITQYMMVFASLAGAGLLAFEVTRSRRRERASLQENRYQTTLLAEVNDAIVGLDKDFRVTYWNSAAERLFERPAQEALRRNYSEVVQSVLSDADRQVVREELLRRGQWRGELVCHKRSGGRIILDVSASVFHNRETNFTGIVGIHRDVTRRREAEEALLASENRFKLAQSVLAIGSWEKNLVTGQSIFSEQMLRLLGITEQREGFAEDEFIQHVHPDDRDRLQAEIQASLKSGTTSEQHFRVVWSDGTAHWLSSKSHTVLDASGQPSRIIGMHFDETEQVLSREQLRESEERFRIMADSCPALMWVTNPQGRVDFINKAYRTFTGVTCQEVKGYEWHFILHPDDEPGYVEAFQSAVRAHAAFHGEVRVRRTDGEWRWFETYAEPHFSADGEYLGHVGLSPDITEHKRANEALRTLEERDRLLAHALQSSAECISITDTEDRLLYVNEAFLRTYGYREDELKGQHIGILRSERTADEMQQEILPATMAGRWCGEIWNRTKDGREFPISLSTSAVLDDQGQRIALVGIARDITESRKAEQAVRFLSSAVEQSPVSIMITDLDGHIEYANRKTTEITGYSFEELKGRRPSILKSGRNSPQEYVHLWETIRTGDWHGVFQNKKKNGELFWESATISPIRDAAGNPTHYLAVKEDISERREIEAALKVSEERFRLITENISEVFWMADPQLTRMLYVSPAYETVWGRSREDLYADPRSFLEPVHPEDRDRALNEIMSGMRAQRPLDQEYRVVLHDGSVRFIRDRGFPVFDSEGVISGYVGIALDVTEQKASERSNAELASIVESSDSAIISKDRFGNILTWNSGAERIYGYSAQEIIGHNIRILAPMDRLHEEAVIHADFLRGNTTRHLQTVRRTKSGNPISVLLTVSPIRDRAGNIIGAAQVAWDTTEQQLMQRQLAQAQKLESIGQLAAGIAHEINTPIQYVGDNAKFLEEAFRDLMRVANPAPDGQIPDDVDVEYLREEVPKAIVQLSEGVEQVARIVRAMKEFSHPGPVEKSPLDINRAIESTILVSKNEWKYVAELTADLDPQLPPVPCVAGEINQVMLNLIVNAAHTIADAAGKTGTMGVIAISTRRLGESVEIRVGDTGTGIPKGIQAKVFDPFFTTKQVGKGTGQGLSIAHAVIVQKHHGTLRFETAVGQGTTFIIELPIDGQGAHETNSICR